jgi:long-chain acyl-CoA synthetase
VRERVVRRLSCVAHCEQVQKFLLLDRPFSIEAGELTPTLKLRRPVIESRFAREIQQLFAE